jgi:hypothetical protein
MPTGTLGQLIDSHREELIRRCGSKAAARTGDSSSTKAEIERGIPEFLDNLVGELGEGPSNKREMADNAARHGSALFLDGFSVGEVVHEYGAVCQSVTDLAVELDADISADEFRTLNRCLDDAIAGAVSEYSRQKQIGESLNQSTTLANLAETAMNGFETLQSAHVGINGATGTLVYRCLAAMRKIVQLRK